jgi:hypothetical protein
MSPAGRSEGAVGMRGYLPGPVAFSVMAVPVLRFVNETFREPVTRLVIDPSEALSSFSYPLLTRANPKL